MSRSQSCRLILFPHHQAYAPDAYEKLVPWAANVLNDLYSKTTLCLRCEAAVIAQIALYLAVRHFTLPEPKSDSAAAGGGGGGGDKAKKPPGTWREVFGLGDDAQTFCEYHGSSGREREEVEEQRGG
jgi:hypothetical protein